MNIMDGEGTDFAGPAVIGWFDSDKAEWWDDADHNGNGSGGAGRGEGIWRTKAGKWVFCRWSNWQGEKTVCTYMDTDAAREWLLKNEFDATVETYFGEVAEEEDRRPGRPEIGGRVTLSLGPDLVAAVDTLAAQAGVKRAEMIRQMLQGLVDAGVQLVGI